MEPKTTPADSALRKAVRERFAALPEIWGYQKQPGLLNRAATSPYRFSGLLKCGECVANLIIATGGERTGMPSTGARGGSTGGCSNDLYPQ